MRFLPFASAAVMTILSASSALADPKACIAASEEGQSLRSSAKLTAAKAAFARCAANECPAVIRAECEKQLTAVDAAIPTVTFGAKADGADLADVSVSVDGASLLQRLDGRQIPLDPGSHVVRFESAGRPAKEITVVTKEGEKGRAVAVEWGAAPPPDGVAAVTVDLRGKAEGVTPVLEAQRGKAWSVVCAAPCNERLPLADTYRINGSGVPTSTPFTLRGQAGGHVSVGIVDGDDGGRTRGLVLTGAGLGAVGLGIGLIVIGAAVGVVHSETAFEKGQCPTGYIYNSLSDLPCVRDSTTARTGLYVTGTVFLLGGIVTTIVGIVTLTGGRASVAQSTVARYLGPDGLVF